MWWYIQYPRQIKPWSVNFLSLVECFSLTIIFQWSLTTTSLVNSTTEERGVKLMLELLLIIIKMYGQTGFVLYKLLVMLYVLLLKM